MRGEMPEYVPNYNLFAWRAQCSFLFKNRELNGKGFDVFGVEFVGTKEADGAALPKPGSYILDDITRWRDVIKAPDLSNIDWETMAKKDLAHIDRRVDPAYCFTHNGYFQALMNFMGFTEGLCALHEEPEEVYALFDYLCDFYCEIEKNLIQYYKPDYINLQDDTATAQNPFISPQMYRDLILPFHKRQADIARAHDIPLSMHNCGRCEDFIDDWLEIGISAWDPAQVMNDLPGIKAKYGRKLALVGCWDSSGPVSWPSSDDQLLRDALVEYVDTYAPGGGFCFAAYIMGSTVDENSRRKLGIIADFYQNYAKNWYQTHA